jgi:UDP-N-acetyl-L-fucosamine synthase
MAGLEVTDVVRAVSLALSDGHNASSLPAGYDINDTSNRVVRFISSTVNRHHQWAGIRTPSHDR